MIKWYKVEQTYFPEGTSCWSKTYIFQINETPKGGVPAPCSLLIFAHSPCSFCTFFSCSLLHLAVLLLPAPYWGFISLLPSKFLSFPLLPSYFCPFSLLPDYPLGSLINASLPWVGTNHKGSSSSHCLSQLLSPCGVTPLNYWTVPIQCNSPQLLGGPRCFE